MNHHYDDIRSKIDAKPLWFDENAVPRYDAFTPDQIADIYADEAVLMRITCQGCGAEFDVALSSNRLIIVGRRQILANLIREREIHYGDPPNIGCCGSGPSMNSEPRRVLEYWHRHDETHTREDDAVTGVRVVTDVGKYFAWQRDPALEIDVTADWVTEP